MRAVNIWVTPYANHTVPSAILWLAGKANALAGVPSELDHLIQADLHRVYKTPGYRVIEEWGNWREEQDRKEYEAGCLTPSNHCA